MSDKPRGILTEVMTLPRSYYKRVGHEAYSWECNDLVRSQGKTLSRIFMIINKAVTLIPLTDRDLVMVAPNVLDLDFLGHPPRALKQARTLPK